MPTRWSLSNTAVSTTGIGLAALGVIWESLLGPSWWGWICIIAGLLLLLWVKNPRITPLFWPILIMLLMGVISLFVTADPHLTTPQVSRLFAGIAGYTALVLWAKSRRQLQLVSLIFIAAGTMIAILAPFIVHWNLAKGIPIPESIYKLFPLLFADAVHPNVMVSIMVLLIPLPIAFLLLSYRRGPWPFSTRWLHLLLILALALLSFILLLTKSRGGYVAGAIGALTVLWFSRHRLLALILTLLTSITGIWLIVGAEQQAATVVGELADTGTMAFRQQVWQLATQMITDFPFTGAGMGTFNEVALRLYPFPEVADPGAHNLYLQVGVDLGIPGLIAFLSILILSLYMSILSISQSRNEEVIDLRAISVGLFAGTTALMFHGFVDITVWGTRMSFLPWLIFGLITAVHTHLVKKIPQ